MDSSAPRCAMGAAIAPLRRRGEALEQAIYAATVSELQAAGYGGLTMERVAAAAHTGKAALYRRWAGKDELIVDALNHALPPIAETPHVGETRADLIGCLQVMIRSVNSPAGCAMQTLLGELHRDRTFMRTLHTRVLERRRARLLEVLSEGIDRGDVRATALTPLVADAGPSLVIQRLIIEGPPVPLDLATEIVDEILLPAVRC